MKNKSSMKLKSSKLEKNTTLDKRVNVKTVVKKSTPTSIKTSPLDILSEETWEYMTEIKDLKYEY